MDSIFNKVCVLVTVAFALTLMPGFRRPERSLLSEPDQGPALLVFLVVWVGGSILAAWISLYYLATGNSPNAVLGHGNFMIWLTVLPRDAVDYLRRK
jgi:hypothetical protein